MALNDEGGGMVMPVGPMNGGGFGFGGDFGSLIVLFFLFMICGGGMWGNGGMNGGLYPWLNNSQNVNDGFRDVVANDNVNGIRDGVFGIGTQLCNGFAGVNAAISNGFAQSEIADNARQMNDMQQMFSLQSQLSQCCCDNRLATVQTQNIVQSEGAATRLAIQQQTQAILDKMCQDKIDAKNEKITELNARINSLEANNYIQNALTAQTQYFLNLYPVPATAAKA